MDALRGWVLFWGLYCTLPPALAATRVFPLLDQVEAERTSGWEALYRFLAGVWFATSSREPGRASAWP